MALIAATAEEDRALCLAAGTEGVLVEPVRRADLRPALAALAR